jgi:hypothetical protein
MRVESSISGSSKVVVALNVLLDCLTAVKMTELVGVIKKLRNPRAACAITSATRDFGENKTNLLPFRSLSYKMTPLVLNPK